jgi:serine/threonine-protein kinase HipA
MRRCPITYEAIDDKQSYTIRGLRRLSPALKHLAPLPFTAFEQRQQAASYAAKMSIQGVQPKFSGNLAIRTGTFELVATGGTYLFKPQSDHYEQVPENEDLTMKMARIVGIQTPVHGMVYSKDGSLTYFIQRFDRYGRRKKYRMEDFAQLTGQSRETKYQSSMEKLIPVIDAYCTFPLVQKLELFRRVIFCFLSGNEDMHLKNFSLITKNGNTQLTPAYDLLNTTMAVPGTIEEMALPVNGKKNRIKREDLIDYYGGARLGLSESAIQSVLDTYHQVWPHLYQLIEDSFLITERKESYKALIQDRANRLSIPTP